MTAAPTVPYSIRLPKPLHAKLKAMAASAKPKQSLAYTILAALEKAAQGRHGQGGGR